MQRMRARVILIAHALVGWALCFATIGIGMRLASVETALIVHAIGAPIYFAGVSRVYFTRFAFTTPIQTAALFTAIVMGLDFFLVALVILRSLDMFASPLGTWIPFALIFGATWLTGAATRTRQPVPQR